jgi:CRISPR type IV-associated protein Csf3
VLNIQVTAHLSSPFFAYDDWSPSLDSLLEYLWLDERGLITPNPSASSLITADIPLEKGTIGTEWYWKVSSPCYAIKAQTQDRFRKRWDYQESSLNWGKRKPKWSTSEGAEKSYDLPVFLRHTDRIDWFAVGDPVKVLSLLEKCSGIGKKRSYGYGQIAKWEVKPIENDYHLWRNGQLMRSIPTEGWATDVPHELAIMRWAWRPPGWLHANQTMCFMPTKTVIRDG